MYSLEEMDKFLEMYNLPRLNQDETENMNGPITSNKIESIIFFLIFKNQNSRIDGFTGKFSQTFREQLIPILLKSFQKIAEKGVFLKLILQSQHHPDPTIRPDTTKKGNHRSISLMNIHANNP